MTKEETCDLGPCPYRPGQRFHALVAAVPQTARYRRLLDANCRRLGDIVYRPSCPGCRACRQLRVDCPAFRPSRSQRRCRRRNADLEVVWRDRGCDEEHGALLARYQAAIHDDASGGDPTHLAYDGGVAGGELQARDESGRLLAVSVVDRFADALSSVYCYYEPDESRRGLGTFMALAEIACCREWGLRWLYLGYHIADCAKMAYKARFRPCQILQEDGWRRPAESPS